MCGKPECMAKVVAKLSFTSLGLRHKWRAINQHGNREDFLQYLALAFLSRVSRGLDTMFSAQWVNWEAQHFLRGRNLQNTAETPTEHLVRLDAGEDMTPSWDDALGDHLRAIDESAEGNPYDTALYDEVSHHMLDNDQAVALLVLREDITHTDAWVVDDQEDFSPDETRRKVEIAQQWVANWAKGSG